MRFALGDMATIRDATTQSKETAQRELICDDADRGESSRPKSSAVMGGAAEVTQGGSPPMCQIWSTSHAHISILTTHDNHLIETARHRRRRLITQLVLNR